MEEKNTNKSLIAIIVILVLVVIGLGGYIIYDKVLSANDSETEKPTASTENNNDVSNENITTEDETDNESETNEVANNCVGTYYGEYTGTSNGINMNYKTTYVLKEDGTFTSDYSGVSSESGTYTISNGTLTVTHMPETGKDAVTGTYKIAEDCSYITITESSNSYNLYKK